MRTSTFAMIALGGTLSAALAFSQTATQSGSATQNQTALLSGRVTRAGGEPVKKATVTLRPATVQGGGQFGQIGQPAQGGQRGQGAQGNPGGGRGGLRSVTTADDGTFTFKDVTPGQYRVSAERDGLVSQEYGQRSLTGAGVILTITAGQRLTTIDFSLPNTGIVAGRIIDQEGEPVPAIQVQASTYEYRQGQRTLVPGKQAQTNDLGEYRIYWLTPGEYYISAVPNGAGGRGGGPDGGGGPRGPRGGGPPVENADPETYAPSYYPGGVDSLRAAPIQISPAAEIRGIDFAIRSVLTAKVSGRVIVPPALPPQTAAQNPQQQGGRGGGRGGPGGPGGPGGGGVEVLLLPAGNGGGGGGRGGRGGGPGGGPGGPGGRGANGPAGRGSVNADGAFEIANVVPGSYTLAAVLRQNTAQYTATTHVDVTESGIQNVTLALNPGVTLSGQISLDGQSTQQFNVQQVRIQLNPVDDIPIGQGDFQIKDNGSFTLTEVASMKYRVNVQLPQNSYLVAGRYGGADALNGPIEVGPDQNTLQLQVGLTPGRVEGNVKDRADGAFSGATVVIVPAARGRYDLYKTSTSNQEGKFTFTNVAPGDYKLFAWEEIQQGAYQDPTYLAAFEDRGKLIHIEKNGTANEQIAVIPVGN